MDSIKQVDESISEWQLQAIIGLQVVATRTGSFANPFYGKKVEDILQEEDKALVQLWPMIITTVILFDIMRTSGPDNFDDIAKKIESGELNPVSDFYKPFLKFKIWEVDDGREKEKESTRG